MQQGKKNFCACWAELSTKMRPSKTCFVAVFVVVLAVSGVDATVVTTCKAAANNNTLVNYRFCVSELSKRNGSDAADTWGLAKLAAVAGAGNARKAITKINDRLTKPVVEAKAGFEQCQKLYGDVASAFLRARDYINDRNYAAGKEQVMLGIYLAQKCDDLLGNTIANPSPLRKYSYYTGNIATVCMAITNIIN
ncbi:hypothetical protein EJB05_21441, partial [Eragrostis curvula]